MQPLRLLRPLLALTVPKTTGTERLEGLGQSVEILRDRWGVPHIYAASLPDAAFAQGWVHAQDRLWQRELTRRVAAGRLSELFGALAFDSDRLLRTVGLQRAAEGSVAALAGEERYLLDAYCRGVNAFIERNPRRLGL